jgi:glycosyltransferase-like protein
MPEPALRILITMHSVNPRGGVVHALELGEALRRAGHEVTLFAPAGRGEPLFRATGCEVVLAPTAPAAGPALVDRVRARIEACIVPLTALIERAPFHILHAQDSITGNALATLRARGAIDGYVRTVHHLDHFDDAQLMAWQTRAFRDAAQVLCVSRLWRDTLRDHYGIAAAPVPNGVDLARYTPQAVPLDAAVARRHGIGEGPVILAVGGVEERKNSLRLLDAFARLRAARPGAQLVIAGGASLLDHDAYARVFAARAHDLGVQGALAVTGPVDDAEMPSLYRLADVLAMPSLREGFGLAVLEALACGTPAVAPRIAPFTEHLTDADVAWADPFDVESIARALSHALDWPRFDSVPEVCFRHDWATSAARHVELYRQALAAAPIC